MPEGRRFFPRDDRAVRRRADDPSETSTPDPSITIAGQRAQRRLERERADPSIRRGQVKFGRRLVDQVALRGARAQDRRAITRAFELPQQSQARFAGMLARLSMTDLLSRPRRATNSGLIVSPEVRRTAKASIGEACWMSSALPARDGPGGIDQADFAHPVADRQRVSDRAAERAASGDRNESHWSRLF